MSDTVIDSSVAAKWILPETDSDHADRVLVDVALKGERLIVLDLALIEIANAIWKLHHRHLATADEARQFLDKLLRLPVHVETGVRLLKAALDISLQYDRAVYDGLFVALCRDLNSQGVTADEPLYNAVHVDFPRIVLLRNW
jgi:predicted nucleic acid-binding protein